jgi:hypothetical protein
MSLTLQLDFKSDTYALLGVGDSSATSAVVSDNNNPAWEGQKFVLFVKDFKADTLKVTESWVCLGRLGLLPTFD